MPHTDQGCRSSAPVLAIGQLSLHRETLENLSGSHHAGRAERRATRGANCGGTSSGPVRTAITCRGHTCNRQCPTVTCVFCQ